MPLDRRLTTLEEGVFLQVSSVSKEVVGPFVNESCDV